MESVRIKVAGFTEVDLNALEEQLSALPGVAIAGRVNDLEASGSGLHDALEATLGNATLVAHIAQQTAGTAASVAAIIAALRQWRKARPERPEQQVTVSGPHADAEGAE